MVDNTVTHWSSAERTELVLVVLPQVGSINLCYSSTHYLFPLPRSCGNYINSSEAHNTGSFLKYNLGIKDESRLLLSSPTIQQTAYLQMYEKRSTDIEYPGYVQIVGFKTFGLMLQEESHLVWGLEGLVSFQYSVHKTSK